jgi:hypothetical protein
VARIRPLGGRPRSAATSKSRRPDHCTQTWGHGRGRFGR